MTPTTAEMTRSEETRYWKERLGRLESWSRVPGHTQALMISYLVDRRQPGGFLGSVLTNDLFGAIGRADLQNRAAIVPIVQVIYSGFPASCWGTEEKVRRWIERRGSGDGA